MVERVAPTMEKSQLFLSALLDLDVWTRDRQAGGCLCPVVVNHGTVFVSVAVNRACGRLGSSLQPNGLTTNPLLLKRWRQAEP